VRRTRVSIKDVARAAGVSHSTVSRALRDSPLISQATRIRIQWLADEMGYVPNSVAQSLQMSRSGTIGLAVTTLSDPYFADIAEGIDEVACRAGFSIFVTSSHNDPETEIRAIETFHRRRVDGIIVASSRLSGLYAQRLERIHVPVVLINQNAEDSSSLFSSVAVDEVAGARLAVEHLLACGHRRIGYLGMGNRLRSNQRRLTGYRQAMANAGIDPPDDWMLIVPDEVAEEYGDVNAGQAAFPQLYATGVTAVLCYNDRTATGALIACRDQDLCVPLSCSIVGFDDIELAGYVTPPLTTIAQPKRDMGRRAMQMVLNLMNERPVTDQVMIPDLVVRQSTAPPA
jgi:LacI family transcriptional regulator/LacI family repressor for deo operon, udp, cdd, tsx, nupC, and nupG